jgi:hypothetical protein
LTNASFSSDHEQTRFIGQLLRGNSLKWYESLVCIGHKALYKYNTFLHKFTTSFQDPNYQTKVNSKIVHLQQNHTPISRYIVQFHCLASKVEYSEPYLIELFLRSLKPKLLTQLSFLV